MIDHDRAGGQPARPARRARYRRRHHRHLLDRQRAAHEHVAGRRDDPLPQREEHQLGGRLPGARDDPVAGTHPGRRRVQRDRPAPRLAAHLPGRRRATPRSMDDLKAGKTIGDKTFKVHIDGYNLLPYLTGEEETARARAWCTSPTTATSWRSGSTTGRSSSWSSGSRERCRSGPSRSSRCESRSCSTCAPTPSSGPTMTSNTYYDSCLENAYLVFAAQIIMTRFLADLRGVPAAAEGGELHHRPGHGEARGDPDGGH